MKRLLSALLILGMCLSLFVVAAAAPGANAHRHVYIPIVTKAATCTEAGIVTYTCWGCGDKKQGTIPATGHRFSEKWKNDETAHWRECINFGCNEVTDKGMHDYEENLWLSDEANHWKVCKICGYVSGVAPHTWDNGKITKASTCTQKGVRTYTCTVCGATRTEPVPLAEHSWDGGTTTIEPTVTEKGESTFRCIACGKTATREIDPLGLSMTPEELLTVAADPANALSGRLEDEKWVILQSVTSEEEYTRIQNGWPITVTLQVKDVSNSVAEDLVQKVQKTAGKQKIYCYLDMNLRKEMYLDPAQPVTEMAEPIIIALTLPQEMMEAASKQKERGFTVYEIEGDDVKKVAAKLSGDGKSLLLQTEELETYALAYRDVRTSGFDTLILLYAALGVLTLGGIGFLVFKLFIAPRRGDYDWE